MIESQTSAAGIGLPPGQRRIDAFPRFGTDLSGRVPDVPADPVIAVRGAVTHAVDVPVAALATLPRRELVADFHCVTGWTAADVRWEGVSFGAFYSSRIAPILSPGAVVTHLVFRGLDGYCAVIAIEDSLAEDVLLADHFDGHTLDGKHGAPVRLVSPRQYGYMSTKHVCEINVLTAPPTGRGRSGFLGVLLQAHPRARVWHEERNGALPTWLIRPLYRALKRPLLELSFRRERAESTTDRQTT